MQMLVGRRGQVGVAAGSFRVGFTLAGLGPVAAAESVVIYAIPRVFRAIISRWTRLSGRLWLSLAASNT